MAIRDNKLLRSKLQAQARNKHANTENQPSPDEQLSRLEEDIRKLRVEFDIFFNGAAKSDGLKERHGCERVKFSVAVENGHVSFKAKAE